MLSPNKFYIQTTTKMILRADTVFCAQRKTKNCSTFLFFVMSFPEQTFVWNKCIKKISPGLN